ncbi:BrxE family protein [Pontibacter toksunensis]|uniref:BrxE family protein n=1 Tax=Pontibacter toksunensis TaxID=1332631 RepID=A0ABW6BSC4_9BACT
MTHNVNNWILLRQLVILSGEYSNWWPTNILSANGEEFLGYALPKTKKSATLHLASQICQVNHDKHIGPGKYHLFRLPQKMEENIFTELRSFISNDGTLTQEEVLSELRRLTGDISTETIKGPVLVGHNTELGDDSILKTFARHYYEAFKNNYSTFPYLN